jgi:NAD(P)-dependent dehydrogenase (short-subunit alcohol dehydrogenase family)
MTKQTVAFVTGGAQGIGKAIVQKLLGANYAVFAVDIDAEAAGELTAFCEDLGEVYSVTADVRDEEAVRKVSDKIDSTCGRLNRLVNNAAINIVKPLGELTLEEWNAVIATNLTGPFLWAKYAAPLLKEAHVSIVNIASTQALQSEANTVAYSASKGCIVALTHSIAVSLGPDVRVNCISPGLIEVGDWKNSSATVVPEHSDADRL